MTALVVSDHYQFTSHSYQTLIRIVKRKFVYSEVLKVLVFDECGKCQGGESGLTGNKRQPWMLLRLMSIKIMILNEYTLWLSHKSSSQLFVSPINPEKLFLRPSNHIFMYWLLRLLWRPHRINYAHLWIIKKLKFAQLTRIFAIKWHHKNWKSGIWMVILRKQNSIWAHVSTRSCELKNFPLPECNHWRSWRFFVSQKQWLTYLLFCPSFSCYPEEHRQ